MPRSSSYMYLAKSRAPKSPADSLVFTCVSARRWGGERDGFDGFDVRRAIGRRARSARVTGWLVRVNGALGASRSRVAAEQAAAEGN